MQVNCDVLDNRCVVVLVEKEFFLDVRGGHVRGNLVIVDVSVLREGQPGQGISDSETLLAAHDTK